MGVIQILANEISGDPLGRGYAGMTRKQKADSLNAVNRPREREIIPAHEIIEATVAAEFTALSSAEKQRYQIIVSAGEVNIQGANTRAALAAMFGVGTATRTNLLALQTELISRAAELNLPVISEGLVFESEAQGVA